MKKIFLIILAVVLVSGGYFVFIRKSEPDAKSKVFLAGMQKELTKYYKYLKINPINETSRTLEFPGVETGSSVQKTLSGYFFSYSDPELIRFSTYDNYLRMIGPTPPWFPRDGSRDGFLNDSMICIHQYAVYLNETSRRDPNLPDNPEIFCADLPQ